jgi:putative acetyltransferase
VSLALRRAEPADFADLAEVQRTAVEAHLRPLYDASAVDRWLSHIDAAKFERVAATGEETWVAVREGRVVGFVSFMTEMSLLAMWYVHSACVGQGIGAALLALAEGEMRLAGCEVAVTEASLFARPRFESLGWTAVEEYDKPSFGATFRVTRMSKALPSG